MSTILFNQRIDNTNRFKTIYLKQFKNGNATLEFENYRYTKEGFLVRKCKKVRTTVKKVDDFLENCDSYCDSIGRFNDFDDLNKFLKEFKLN